jgi:N-acetylmuramoyl-L-alanine amidase
VEAGRNFSGQTIRRDFSDKDPDWEEDFTILSQTACAAVLTENFFMDNEQDLAYLVSEEGREAILNVHVNGIVEYVKANGKH